MAYLRWGYSDWYVFWHSSEATRPEDELLAVWSANTDRLPCYHYTEVTAMLRSGDFTRIPGFTADDEAELRPVFEAFVHDVDCHYKRDEKEAERG